ncbi:formate dehydrogenase (NAD+) [Aspergillus melleus]|uniref:Formate dehydrogenase (NAD+) n=1 Tax=Aspergillus melleus TaxID=138277 RepID=A0ACC3BGZ7_9EURO|nr:formate dehydrogenase (NAD+) [Aspergillus melleus]
MPSSPVTCAATEVTSGSPSPLLRTTLSATPSTRGAAATPWCLTCPAILESYFTGRHDYRLEDLIVKDGDYVTKAYGQRNKA